MSGAGATPELVAGAAGCLGDLDLDLDLDLETPDSGVAEKGLMSRVMADPLMVLIKG